MNNRSQFGPALQLKACDIPKHQFSCAFLTQAAFQLLEERDRLFPTPVGLSGSVWEGTEGEGGGAQGCGTNSGVLSGVGRNAGRGLKFHYSGLNRQIIKAGILRKATARSVGRLEKTTWKNKYIELTPGMFAYADGPSVLGKRCAKP